MSNLKDTKMNDPNKNDTLPRLITTVYAPSSPLEESVATFWQAGNKLDEIEITIEPPDAPLEFLEKLGPSPFERGAFPLIGFLATTYDKVSRYALERSNPRP